MSSLTTGILANEDLKSKFSDARKGLFRAIKVVISGEQLVSFYDHKPNDKTWDEDFDNIISPLLSNTPCYIFYRLDVKNSLGQYQWLFLVYSPEDSNTRDKMLYSSTRSNVKKEFGGENIKFEIFGVDKSDLSMEGYSKFLISLDAPNPLTEEEQIIADIHSESHNLGTTDRSSHIGGLNFPIEGEFWVQLDNFKKSIVNYIEISIDVNEEKILFEDSGSISISELKQKFPSYSPRYFLYRYTHIYEGVTETADVFIYYSPGYKSSIKERMLYSSSISGLLSKTEEMGIIPVKRLEVGSEDDLSDTILIEEIHPPKVAPKTSFAKPKPPVRSKQVIKAKPIVSDECAHEFGNFYDMSS